MNKFERKLKEATAQTTASLLTKLRALKKDWKRGSLMGSGCFVNITTLEGSKTDYIKFIDLGSRDMMEIARFLRQYDRANVKIDASPFDRHMMNEEIYRL